MSMNDDFVDWDALETQLSDIVLDDAIDVSTLEDMELLNRFHAVTEELRLLGKMLRPDTQESRDLQSERAALRIELAKRELM